jgi:hypothetical protein
VIFSFFLFFLFRGFLYICSPSLTTDERSTKKNVQDFCARASVMHDTITDLSRENGSCEVEMESLICKIKSRKKNCAYAKSDCVRVVL